MNFKKIISAVLAVCLVGTICTNFKNTSDFPIIANAEETEEEYTQVTEGIFKFDVYNDYAAVSGCDTNAEGEITIPAEINGLPVKYIFDEAFKDCKGLTSVNVPDSIEAIGYAFWYCTSLTSINIPDSVVFLGDAFFGCSSLTSINIPKNITRIVAGTFNGCSSLTSVDIPDNVTFIGMYTFYGCNSLEKVTVFNPDCEFDVDVLTDYDGIIYGYENSTAQAYAEKYGFKFESLGIYEEQKELSVGDINDDNTIDSSDASDVLAIYSELSTKDKSEKFTAQQIKAADVNGDKQANSADASTILQYYALSSTNGTETFEEFLERTLNNK